MELPYHTCDVFTERAFGGNPLAVFPEAGELDGEEMQNIAREMNLSETAFVVPRPEDQHSLHLRIFTPTAEIPFAGHPTIGTALVLGWTGAVSLDGGRADLVFHEGVGPVEVSLVRGGAGGVRAELTPPVLPGCRRAGLSWQDVAESVGLEEEDLTVGDAEPEVWSSGFPVLTVPVLDREALGRARVNARVWDALVSPLSVGGVYLFARGGWSNPEEVRVRFFAPDLGVPEDPACGSGALALAGYLCAHHPGADGWRAWIITQGVEMGRPSTITVRAEVHGGAVRAARLGGTGVWVCRGVMSLERKKTDS